MVDHNFYTGDAVYYEPEKGTVITTNSEGVKIEQSYVISELFPEGIYFVKRVDANSVKLAKRINGEIINADSMQVYKDLKILSARPTRKDYQKIKHHLYGFLSSKKNFSSGEWLKLAKKKINLLQKLQLIQLP